MNYTIRAIILATLLIAATQFAIAAPANDNWLAPEVITGVLGARTGTTADGTAQQCEPQHDFPDIGTQMPSRTSWYVWTAPETGSYTFKANSMILHTISAYVMVPSMCSGNVVNVPHAIAENQAFFTPTMNGIDVQVTFAAKAGNVIYISVDGYGGSGGTYTMAWVRNKYRYSTQLDSRDPGTDIMVIRDTPSGVTEWWFQRSTSQPVLPEPRYGAIQFGRSTDKKLMGDFDGDGITDLAAIRPENGVLTWWIMNLQGQVLKVVQFGLATDRPIVGDYDGDGIADIAVTRSEFFGQPKVWHFLRSSDGSYSSVQFGLWGDEAMVGDYDGDGKSDVVVLRLSGASDYTWYILRSSDGSVQTKQFGRGGDIPQAADIDRDGKTDLIMFRSNPDDLQTAGKWYWINSNSAGQINVKSWGQQLDRPQIGDYDADGVSDLAIYRPGSPSVWWLARSGSGVTNFGFGQTSDRPMSDLGLMNAFLVF